MNTTTVIVTYENANRATVLEVDATATKITLTGLRPGHKIKHVLMRETTRAGACHWTELTFHGWWPVVGNKRDEFTLTLGEDIQ